MENNTPLSPEEIEAARVEAELESLKAEIEKEAAAYGLSQQETEAEVKAHWVPSAKVRKCIYTSLAAAVPLAVAYGLFSESEAGLWLGFVGALLGSGGAALAGVNTHN